MHIYMMTGHWKKKQKTKFICFSQSFTNPLKTSLNIEDCWHYYKSKRNVMCSGRGLQKIRYLWRIDEFWWVLACIRHYGTEISKYNLFGDRLRNKEKTLQDDFL